jgi:hypothetical protein
MNKKRHEIETKNKTIPISGTKTEGKKNVFINF